MKIRTRLLALLLCAALLVCSGCADLSQALADALAETALADLFAEPVWVGFSSAEDDSVITFQKAEDLEEYRSVYRCYSTDTYYSLLDAAGQRVYRLLEYALDHGRTRILLDEALTDELDYPVSSVLTFLSLDSPMVEQNLAREEQDVTAEGEKTTGFFTTPIQITGTLVTVERFSQERLERKKEALAKAQTIVDALPDGLSDVEQGEWLYRYLRENVAYQTYFDNTYANYLYDALCTGMSHCDGFANALSLLCNMVGIPCFEKLYLPNDEDENGHTWNCLQLGGAWYNADAAVSSDDVDEVEEEIGFNLWYGYSDTYETYTPYLANYLPACETDLLEVDFTAQSPEETATKILDAFRTTDRSFVYFALNSVPMDPSAWQRISNRLRANIYWVILDAHCPYRYIVMKQ